jgi:hypothetical protein
MASGENGVLGDKHPRPMPIGNPYQSEIRGFSWW